MAHRQTAADGGEPEVVRIRLLGGFGVRVGPRAVGASAWRRRKAGGLVKLLALAREHKLHRERVTATLWPDLDTKPAANNLHRTLHIARAALEPDAERLTSRHLALVGDMLELCPEGSLWVDVEAFEAAATNARRIRDPAAYRAAIELYAGDLLPEDLFEEWAQHRREELRLSHRALLVELAGLHEDRGEYTAAVEALRKVVAEDPTSEVARAGLMRILALGGRQHEAILQYEQLRGVLSRKHGTKPAAATRRLHEDILAGRFPAAASPSAGRVAGNTADHPPNNLPVPLTSFVGRERELVEARRLLSTTRLLTLTGAGGSGKTRLALEAARTLLNGYPDGVWIVELAPLSDPALVPRAVAQVLGVREQPGRALVETLVTRLRAKNLLLVMDNCEHLVDATAELVGSLLGACPKVRILATSREPLNVPGEIVWSVPPLSLPSSDEEQSFETIVRSEAGQLFAERARSRLPGFVVNEENAGAVGRVCRKLDGIPLAIELACARMGTLTVEQIAEGLEDSLRLLTGGSRTAQPRQQTMRATLEWGYRLLEEKEKKLFRRLPVFADGWTLEAAEEVCSGGGIGRRDVLDLLSRLVDKSLVLAEASPGEGASRYGMLEPIRQYARELPRENEEERGLRRRHAIHYLALAERAEPELLGSDQGRWLGRMRTELGNMRRALSWSLEPGGEERAVFGLRLAAALWRFWDVEGFQEGRAWLQAALEKSPDDSSAVRAKALSGLGWILLFQRHYARAISTLEEAVARYKDLGDASGTAFALANLMYAALHAGHTEIVPALVEEAEALARGDLEGHARAFLLTILAAAAMEEGDLESAVSQLEESLALSRELGDPRGASMALFTMGMAELERGDLDRGAALLEEGSRIARELRDRLASAYYVWGLGKVNALRGRMLRAAKLWGAAEALREHMGMTLSYFDLAHSDYERDLARARSPLGESAWSAAWAEGRAMGPDQALRYALSTQDTSPRRAPGPRVAPPPGPLTRREREVALLVGRGFTNREIARELGVNGRTVETHVSRILKKLGLRSRTGIAAWAIEQGRFATGEK